MRSLGGSAVTALAAANVVMVQLILLQFSTNGGTDVALNTSNMDIAYGGVTYKGAYGLGSISKIMDAPGEIHGIQFDLAGVAASSVSLALDDSDDWQGAPVTVRTAILDATTYAVIDAPIEWAGLGDTMSIEENGETCFIQATAESNAVDLLNGSAMTYSDADQQALYSGDLAFQYVASQAEERDVWPAREYFFK